VQRVVHAPETHLELGPNEEDSPNRSVHAASGAEYQSKAAPKSRTRIGLAASEMVGSRRLLNRACR
jgi:hypothetical protein